MRKLSEKMSNLKLIVYDFDGVMTDNKVMLDEFGKETVTVNRGDGYGVGEIKKLGIEQVIISTETNNVVRKRAEKLKIDVINAVQDKKSTVENYCRERGYSLSETMFIGNDLNDFEAIMICGVKGAPADAEPEILEIADWISSKAGGDGVIRELYRILKRLDNEK